MPLLVEPPRSPRLATATSPAIVEIALLNNLGDGGLECGERRFLEILSEASGPDPVRLRLFSLPGITRGPGAQARLATHYADFVDLMQSRVDGLIVTGCEPVAANLPQEPVWGGLTEVIDWAEHNTRSTIWSCLAAHAAVLHLDGIERRPLPRKCSGLFTVERTAAHPLLAGIRTPLVVPHSRWNGLDEPELAASGYEILTRSDEVGVDLFLKRWKSLFVYLQGHPEYDEGALRGEYRRDVLRYLSGLSPTYPDQPAHYFPAALAAELSAFEDEVRRDPGSTTSFPLKARGTRGRRWRRALAVGLLRNWLRYLRTARLDRAA